MNRQVLAGLATGLVAMGIVAATPNRAPSPSSGATGVEQSVPLHADTVASTADLEPRTTGRP